MDRSDLEFKADHDRIIQQGAQLTGICVKMDKVENKIDKMTEKLQDYIDKIDEKLESEKAKSAGHCEALRNSCPIKNKVDQVWFWWIIGPVIGYLVALSIFVSSHVADTGKLISTNKYEIEHLKGDMYNIKPDLKTYGIDKDKK